MVGAAPDNAVYRLRDGKRWIQMPVEEMLNRVPVVASERIGFQLGNARHIDEAQACCNDEKMRV